MLHCRSRRVDVDQTLKRRAVTILSEPSGAFRFKFLGERKQCCHGSIVLVGNFPPQAGGIGLPFRGSTTVFLP
jgi:hypothetical protein